MLLFTQSVYALSGNAIEGKVVEEGTNKPIPRAIVVARWIGNVFAFVESPSACVHVMTATTDAEGKYHFPAWRKESSINGVHDVRQIVIAYKPSYELAKRYPENNPMLQPFTGTREERLKYIESIKQSTISCADPKANGENLIPLYRALYEEAKPLVQTKDEQSIANGFLSWIKILERDPGR